MSFVRKIIIFIFLFYIGVGQNPTLYSPSLPKIFPQVFFSPDFLLPPFNFKMSFKPTELIQSNIFYSLILDLLS